jgi:hypothetical protein
MVYTVILMRHRGENNPNLVWLVAHTRRRTSIKLLSPRSRLLLAVSPRIFYGFGIRRGVREWRAIDLLCLYQRQTTSAAIGEGAVEILGSLCEAHCCVCCGWDKGRQASGIARACSLMASRVWIPALANFPLYGVQYRYVCHT